MTGALTLFDYLVIAALLASALLGLMRGFVREVLSLAGWALAGLIAYRFCGAAANWLPERMPGGELARDVVAFVALFALTLIIVGWFAALLVQLLKTVGLSGLDRVLGCGFGVLRGVLVLIVAMTLAALTPAAKQPFWQHAQTRPYLQIAANVLQPWLPETFARYLTP